MNRLHGNCCGHHGNGLLIAPTVMPKGQAADQAESEVSQQESRRNLSKGLSPIATRPSTEPAPTDRSRRSTTPKSASGPAGESATGWSSRTVWVRPSCVLSEERLPQRQDQQVDQMDRVDQVEPLRRSGLRSRAPAESGQALDYLCGHLPVGTDQMARWRRRVSGGSTR